jgi:MerR family transcriptional regulator, thiopeptide resistance regulator
VKTRPESVYRTQQFARLAGVTVRALHHYDRLGLLKPSGRSATGYRLYRDSDLARLEQIVVLKFLGLPLKEIGRLVRRQLPLVETLQRQQLVLTEKRQQLGAAIEAIELAERSVRNAKEVDWGMFVQIVREIEMQNETEWSKKYYSPGARAKIEERKKLWSPELQAQVTKDWNALLADVKAAVDAHEPVSGPRAQALAARWRKLLEGFTGGDPEVQKGLNKMWADQQNWPGELRGQYSIDPRAEPAAISRPIDATMRNGAVVAPGSQRPKYTDPARCPMPLSSMMIANGYAATRIAVAPAYANGETAKRTRTSTARPAIQGPNVNVGMGNQPSRSRAAVTMGL